MVKQSNLPTKKRGKKQQLDLKKLRDEFIGGNWNTMTAFLEEKGLPKYYLNNKTLSGAVTEKKRRQENIEKLALSKQMAIEADEIMKARLRQSRIARYLQLRGSEALKDPNLKVSTVDEARKLVVSGLEQERKAMGMDREDGGKKLTQININTGPKTNLDRLIENADYEELLGLIAELKRLRARRSISEASGDSPGEVEDGEIS